MLDHIKYICTAARSSVDTVFIENLLTDLIIENSRKDAHTDVLRTTEGHPDIESLFMIHNVCSSLRFSICQENKEPESVF